MPSLSAAVTESLVLISTEIEATLIPDGNSSVSFAAKVKTDPSAFDQEAPPSTVFVAPVINGAFAEPLPPAVDIPSASVPVTFVSPKVISFETVAEEA